MESSLGILKRKLKVFKGWSTVQGMVWGQYSKSSVEVSFQTQQAPQVSLLQLPPSYCLNNKTQVGHKFTKTSRRNATMVYNTGKHTSLDEVK